MAVEIYFPVVHSKSLKAKYDEAFGGNYWKWISWSARFDMANPTELLEHLIRW
jgi:hypothetical protein